MARKKVAYSKYQQWCDAGRPYWTGVALANAVPGFAHLKRQLNRVESDWNRQKLDGFLAEHLAQVPAEILKEEDRVRVQETEAAMQAPPAVPTAAEAPPAAPKRVVKLKGGKAVEINNAVADIGPNIPAAWSESKMTLPSFEELPDVLKKARIDNNERRRRASMLHDQLAEGIDNPGLRRDVVQEIVELMDLVSASYDAEREYVLNRVVPLQDPDIREQYERLELYQLGDLIVNKLRSRVSYWRRQCKLRDGDELVEAKLRLAEAEHETSIAVDVQKRKRQQHEQAAEAERRKVQPKKPSKP